MKFKKDQHRDRLAVVGLSFRLPGADDLQTFWENIINKKSFIKDIPTDRWYPNDIQRCNKAALLDNPWRFDNTFFAISDFEASQMDPQQRILLEESYRCIESSGIDPAILHKKRVGVIVGNWALDYVDRLEKPDDNNVQFIIGTAECNLANRISYYLNFSGVSKTLNVACASSLLALHDARQVLLNDAEDFVLVACANILSSKKRNIGFNKSGMLSRSAQSRVFDVRADGYIPGEGVVAFLLTKSDYAYENGLHVYAEIENSATSHNAHQPTITSPSRLAQTELIKRVWGERQNEIDYVELHGTGTSLGDPIEINALSRITRLRDRQCYVGSLKSNIGHLESVSGLAALVKLICIFKYQMVPPNVNLEKLNPLLASKNTNIVIPTEPIRPESEIRMAGVSAFGFGGVNVHVLVSKPKPSMLQDDNLFSGYPFLLSAHTKKSLQLTYHKWQQYVNSEEFSNVNLQEICSSLMHRCLSFPYRIGMVFRSKDELINFFNEPRNFSAETHPDKIFAELVLSNKKNHISFLNEILVNVKSFIKPLGKINRIVFSESLELIAPFISNMTKETLTKRSVKKLYDPNTFFDAPMMKVGFVSTGKEFLPIDLLPMFIAGIQRAIADFSLDEKGWEQICLLYRHQFTFKRFIDGFKIPFPMSNDTGYSNFIRSENRGVIICLIICALSKLQNRWDLENIDINLPEPNDEIKILVTLYLEEIIDEGLVYDLIIDEPTALSRLNHILNEKHYLLTDLPIFLLVSQFVRPVSLSNLPEYDALVRNRGERIGTLEIEFPGHQSCVIHFNNRTAVEDNDHMDAYVKLWEAGVNVNWKAIIPPRNFRRHPLPGYSFSGKNFKIGTEKENIRCSQFVFKDKLEKVARLLSEDVPEMSFVHLIMDEGTRNHFQTYPQFFENTEVLMFGEREKFLCQIGDKSSTLYILLPLIAKDINAIQSIYAEFIALIQLLQQSNYTSLSLIVLASELENPFHTVFHGVLNALREEQPNWDVRYFDMEPNLYKQPTIWRKFLGNLLNSQFNNASFLIKNNEISKRKLVPESYEVRSGFQNNGCYVLIGGAGGIGRKLASYLLDKYNATIYILGRSRIDMLGDDLVDNKRVYYYQVDATNRVELQAVISKINKEKAINAIFHLAIDFPDNMLLVNMNADLAFKKISQNFYLLENCEHVSNEFSIPLVVFSSIQSRSAVMGASTYSGISLLKEAWLSRLDSSSNSRVIRLGMTSYGLGEDDYLKKSFLKKGILSLEEDEIITGCEAALASDDSCLTIVKKTLEDSSNRVATSSSNENDNLTLTEVTDILVSIFTDVLGAHVSASVHFEEIAIDSLLITAIHEKVTAKLVSLPITVFYNHVNISSLAEYIFSLKPSSPKLLEKKKVEQVQVAKDDEIAIIGIDFSFPEANNFSELWDVINSSNDTASPITSARWPHAEFYKSPGSNEPGKYYVNEAAFIENVKAFDPAFFNLTPKQARSLDPQLRRLLQTAYHALEDACYPPNTKRSSQFKFGVFVGAGKSYYNWRNIKSAYEEPHTTAATSLWSLANRISYHFNFTGPSLTVDTACSSSLTAVHLACKSILEGECDIALTGSVNLILHPRQLVELSDLEMLAKTPGNKTFTKYADGFLPAEGVAVLVLKSYKRAREDNDSIYGVIKGSAISAAGHTNGFTVPSSTVQTDLIQSALKAASVNAEDLSYLEAHGSGTSLGDPIEVEAIKNVFHDKANKKTCAIGSAKMHFGHMESAAGLLGIIKVISLFKHKKIISNLYKKDINPHIDLANSPLYFPNESKSWVSTRADGRLMAGVSSFGAGGMNGHIILSSHGHDEQVFSQHSDAFPVCISAKTRTALKSKLIELNIALQKIENNDLLPSICFNLSQCREHFSHRLAFVVTNLSELKYRLSQFLESPEFKEKLFLPEDKHHSILFSKIKRYMSGELVDWDDCFRNVPYFRLKLPLYPFDESDYWIDFESSSTEPLDDKVCLTYYEPSIESSIGEKIDLHALRQSASWSFCDFNERLSLPESISNVVVKITDCEKDLTSLILFIHKILRSIDSLKKDEHRCLIVSDSKEAIEKIHFSLHAFFSSLEAEHCTVKFGYGHMDANQNEIVLLKKKPVRQLILSKKKNFFEGVSKVYLVTGGMGGVGKVLLRYLMSQYKAHIVVMGRSDIARHAAILNELNSLPGTISYYQGDVSCFHDVECVIKAIIDHYGSINGVFHCAGLIYPQRFENLDDAVIRNIIDVKVEGAKNLDIATQYFQLDCFVLYSSLSGIVGLTDNSIYALANASLCEFAILRAREVAENRRTGKTLALAWPQWQSSGMSLGNSTVQAGYDSWMNQQYGIENLPDAAGMEILETCLSSQSAVIAPLYGRELKSTDKLFVNNNSKSDFYVNSKNDANLMTILMELAELRSDEINADLTFGELGFDSLLLKRFSAEVAKHFDIDCSPSLFFSHNTPNKLIQYLNKIQCVDKVEDEVLFDEESSADIAIIGMQVNLPMASTLSDYLSLIKDNKDAIIEVPETRWDFHQFMGDFTKFESKIASKYGGFISDVEMFDAAFFQISPREAILMDPQQRLLLQQVYHAIEHAGCAPKSLASKKIGVYIGAQFSDYAECLLKQNNMHAYLPTGNEQAMLANRISYYFDFSGPSEVINTACSSSLVAVNSAVEALRNQSCEMAVVGGVSLLLSPTSSLMASQMGVLSPDGRCKTFDTSANGYVKGEGLGVVILKRYNQAINDGDTIHAVIKATQVNHGGKANTLTAPNSQAQSDLLINAYEKSNCDLRGLGYLELHGTGTELGDPIEVDAIKNAFEQLQKKQNHFIQSCQLGSVKANIGHLEPAAGIAGLIKLVLALEHNIKPGNAHLKTLNPYIKLANTPFKVNAETMDWEKCLDADGEPIQRLAGVSSFGFGGVNAHAVIAESQEANKLSAKNFPFYLLAISANCMASLHRKLIDLKNVLVQYSDKDLFALTCNLNKKRDHFLYRTAWVFDSIEVLAHNVDQTLQELSSSKVIKNINVKDFSLKEIENLPTSEFKDALDEMKKAYLSGQNIDWNKFYKGYKVQNLDLPLYPFDKREFWYTQLNVKQPEIGLSINESSTKNGQYQIDFGGDEFYFTDHVINNRKLLPGVFYFEIIASLREFKKYSNALLISDCYWAQAYEPTDSANHLYVDISQDGEMYSVEIFSLPQGQKTVHFVARVSRTSSEKSRIELNQEDNDAVLKQSYYQYVNAMGHQYGPSFQCLDWVVVNGNEAWGVVTLTNTDSDYESAFMLHPSLLDAALGVALALEKKNTEISKPLIPFSVGQVKLYFALPKQCYVYVKHNNSTNLNREQYRVYDFTVTDMNGAVLMQLNQFVSKFLLSPIDRIAFYERVREAKPISLHQKPLHQLIYFVSEDDQAILKGITDENAKFINFNSILYVESSIADFLEENVSPHENVTFVNLVKSTSEKISEFFFLLAKMLMKRQQRSQVRFIHCCQYQKELSPYDYMLVGFARSINQENPNYQAQIIAFDPSYSVEASLKKLQRELKYENDDVLIYYEGENRFVENYAVSNKNLNLSSENLYFSPNQTVVIIGGAGGLGLMFAKHIAMKHHCDIVLLGRSLLSDQLENKLKQINTNNNVIEYRQCDVTDASQLKAVFKKIAHSGRHVCSVLHCAAVINHALLLEKSLEDVEKVLAPKVQGTDLLLKILPEFDVKNLILFSSISSVIGSFGLVDYACANAYLDASAALNSSRINVLTINWPIWKDGGMQVSEEAFEKLAQQFGMPINLQIGLELFEICCRTKVRQIVLLDNQISFKRASETSDIPSRDTHAPRPDVKKLMNFLKSIIVEATLIESHHLNPETSFDEMGIDSVLVLNLTQLLEGKFGRLPRTLFYECSNLKELTQYFIDNYPNVINKEFVNEKPELSSSYESAIERSVAKLEMPKHVVSTPSVDRDVAIVGIAGRYPMAETLDDFWENLLQGKDCITEIPKNRWNYENYFDPNKNSKGTIHSKWGSFLDNVAAFDPLFFNISPREAELMDPQERLFLQIAWQVLEDAGYTPSQLTQLRSNNQLNSIGVYVGVMYGQYQLYAAEEMLRGNNIGTNVSYASIANRVSYYLGLHGPSFAIDSACSSSLTAVHLACQAIREGECEAAIAGGVNVSIHPNKYILLSDTKFLSTEGKCRSFGVGGDGYVPGEGVGAVLLKSLNQAIEDKDYIYGVIKASAINHGGKSNGYTVPNPIAQADVIAKSIKNLGVSPETISYIEAHGTGTELGDPIEIRGLNLAFSRNTSKKQFCPIGSLKSNIGHLEGAAGIAALTKVLLQMKYKKLVPTIHTKELNPHIDFDETAFYVQTQLQDWLPTQGLRRAGISSFGAGGANTHILVDEYVENTISNITVASDVLVFIFSAKNKHSLINYLSSLLKWLDRHVHDLDIQSLAYMLACRRSRFISRAAIVCQSISELQEVLQAILDGRSDDRGFLSVETNDKLVSSDLFEEMGETLLDQLILNETITSEKKTRKLKALADLFVRGYEIEFSSFFKNIDVKKMPIPPYAFDEEIYWIPGREMGDQVTMNSTRAALHPLIDDNISILGEQKYQKTFSPHDFYLSQHKVDNRAILPGAVYVEMAIAATKLAQPNKHFNTVSRINWVRPFELDKQAKKVLIQLRKQQDSIICQFYNESDSKQLLLSECQVDSVVPVNREGSIDVVSLQEKIKICLSKTEIYTLFDEYGIQYGERFQGISKLWLDDNTLLAKLTAIDDIGLVESASLSPNLLDIVLQSVFGFIVKKNEGFPQLFLPFSIDQIKIQGDFTETRYVYAEMKSLSQSDALSFDVFAIDEHGRITLEIKNYIARALERQSSIGFTPIWKQRVNKALTRQTDQVKIALILSSIEDGALRFLENDQYVFVITSEECRRTKPGLYYVNPTSEDSWTHLFSLMDEDNLLPERWINLYPKAKPIDLYYHFLKAVYQSSSIKRFQWLHVYDANLDSMNLADNEMLLGLSKSLLQENPLFQINLIGIKDHLTIPHLITKLIMQFETNSWGELIQFKDSDFYVEEWESIPSSQKSSTSEKALKLKDGGIYIITGGAGGLGLIFADYMVRRYQANVILLGRSDLTEAKLEKLSAIEKTAGSIAYMRCDITQQDEVASIFEHITKNIGNIDGVLHCAGVQKSDYFVRQEKEHFYSTLMPKVQGTENLVSMIEQYSVPLLVLFSSISSIQGSFGLVGYSAANAFLDSVAKHQKRTNHRIISINWPIWRDGGMTGSDEAMAKMAKIFGDPISNEDGLAFFELALQSGQSALSYYLPKKNQDSSKQKKELKQEPSISTSSLLEKARSFVKEVLSEELRLDISKIKNSSTFDQYGIDSILVLNIQNMLEEKLSAQLPKTLFFEYQTVDELAAYFIDQFSDYFQEQHVEAATESESVLEIERFQRLEHANYIVQSNENDIAIVGMSGTYPEAEDIKQFWDNLLTAKNCITEIPLMRWNWRDYFNPDTKMENVMHSKWGGFVPDADAFDPLFFSISPAEAELMDPQERLFLQQAWRAMEDAGYCSRTIDRRTGVFVGVMYGHYELKTVEQWREGNKILPNSLFASIANRLSYFLNLQGPSLAVDTMCSSSLTALHLACESLKRGECDTAFVGGVNIATHPYKYLLLSSGKVLSNEGKCKSFSEGANGMVPAEGVGVVILKRLKDALAAEDNIYAVIKGMAINHGGRTNSYTVPNVNAHADLIEQALNQAGVSARSVSYVEAHGTGTALGDPVEIRGLTKAYAQHTDEKQYCSIGSVKSNIGHPESAAGMAALSKVILQLHHKKLVPSLYAENSNPDIPFAQTPFYLQKNVTDWQADFPRTAGISSFGAGGSNAHMILQEAPPRVKEDSIQRSCYLILLSAKSEYSLWQRQKELLQFLNALTPDVAVNLSDISYTLAVGRDHFNYRTALVASSISELIELLQNNTTLHCVNAAETSAVLEDIELSAAAGNRDELLKIASAYMDGVELNFDKLFDGEKCYRVHLPTYSFEKERYWISDLGLSRDRLAKFEESYLYQPSWQSFPLPSLDVNLERFSENMLIFSNVDQMMSLENSISVFISDTAEKSHPLQVNLANDDDSAILDILMQHHSCKKLVFCYRSIKEDDFKGVQFQFKLLKALQSLGLDADEYQFIVITFDASFISRRREQSADAAIHGLSHTIKQEYPHWRVYMFDMDFQEWTQKNDPWSDIKKLIQVDVVGNGVITPVRKSNFYRYAVKPYKHLSNVNRSFIQNGVYIVAGGAGGLGKVLSEYLARNYKSHLIWLGRRRADAGIRQAVAELKLLGSECEYHSIDITDLSELEKLYQQLVERGVEVNGIVHSAVVLSDKALYNMDEESFSLCFDVKAKGLINLYAAFERMSLDFIMCFSSIASFTGSIGQANYTAASTFQDAYMHSINLQEKCKAYAINWGYWGSTGAVAKEFYQNQFLENGISSIDEKISMSTLDEVMKAGAGQYIIMNASQQFVEELNYYVSVDEQIEADDSSLVESIENDIFKGIEKWL